MNSIFSFSRAAGLAFILCGWGVSGGHSAEPAQGIPPLLPVEDFARPDITSGVALSRDGKTMAYTAGLDYNWTLIFRNWDTGAVKGLKDYADDETPQWINEERVIFGSSSSIDRDLGNLKGTSWMMGLGVKNALIYNRFTGSDKNRVLVRLRSQQAGFPDVGMVNTRDDKSYLQIENPGRVIDWLLDGKGFVRAAIELDAKSTMTRLIVRDTEKSPWVVPPGLDFSKERRPVHWLSADGQTLYVCVLMPTRKWGLYSYDLRKGAMGDLILAHSVYDIAENSGAVRAPKTGEILGFYYTTDKVRAVWFDSRMAALQQALDQNLPGHINLVTSLGDDLQRMIINSSSAKDPGSYYQFDAAKNELKKLFSIRPWIKPELMAEPYPASYKARDGLLIRGYLTLPVGRGQKNLPLVVIPHGTLWDRDTLGFNSLDQFLANRGYAVLRINYRGSTGYGQDFLEKGFRQIGRAIQDDITDGTLWAIKQGIADPKRVAILGDDFGGYSAIIGAMRHPDLYRCAISFSGQTDWRYKENKEDKDDNEKDAAHELFRERIGDPVTDLAELTDISPVMHVDQLRVPLLLSEDTDDKFQAFIKALNKAGKSYQLIEKIKNKAGPAEVTAGYLVQIETFLAKNMPAPAAMAKD